MKLFLTPVWLLVFLSFVMTSCKSDASKNGVATHENEISENTRRLMNWNKRLVSDSLIHTLSQPKLLVRFDDKYPVETDVLDSLLYVVMVRSDTAVYVYNKNTSEFCYSFGLLGGGPQDVLSPNLLKNNYESKEKGDALLFYDLNAKKIVKNVGTQIVPSKAFASEMYPSDQLNISGDYWVGKKLRGDNDDLFLIYNAHTQKVLGVEQYPQIPDLDERIDKSYLYSVVLASNKAKNRIIAGMYFFDLVLVYDFEGKLLHSLSLADNYEAKAAVERMVTGDGHIGLPYVYATDKYCYLCRCLTVEKPHKERTAHILRIDWDGNIAGIYFMDKAITGGFCVDEAAGEMYCISHETEDSDEYYDIVSYKL